MSKKYTLTQIFCFFEHCKNTKIPYEISVVKDCPDDGYSCSSYSCEIGFKYYLPHLGWISLGYFSPKEVFESPYFKEVWNYLPEIEENVFTYGKHTAFDELIGIKKQKTALQILKNKSKLFSDEEFQILNNALNKKED